MKVVLLLKLIYFAKIDKLFSFTVLASSTVVKAENIDTTKSAAVSRTTEPGITITPAKEGYVFKLSRNSVVYPTVNDAINDASF